MRENLLTAKLVLLSASVSVFAGATCYAQSAVRSISIQSSWGGLGQPSSSQLVITQKKGKFQSGARRYSDEEVQAFVGEVERDFQPQTRLEAFGINENWLQANASAALRNYLPKWQYKEASETQRQLFLSAFMNHEVVEDAVSKYLPGGGIDDIPEIKVTITRTNGAQINLQTFGYGQFLGNWLVSSPSGSFETTSAAISLSLWRLLPTGFTNRERLSEKTLRYMIAGSVMTSLREKWDARGAEALLGSATEPVTRKFELLNSAVSSLLSIDLNGAESWNAVVRNSTLPPNVRIGLSLPIREKKLVGVDAFLRRIDDYVRLALSPMWLREFLSTHPDATLEIRFVEDRSLSYHAERRFTEEMLKLGKSDVAQSVSRLSADVAFVELKYGTWSRWIVLPNGDMVLWEFQGEKVGNWSEKDFRISDCYGWKCVGSMIPASGKPN